MSGLFSKFAKVVHVATGAIDAATDVLTKDVSSMQKVTLYKYSDLTSFVSKMKCKFPSVSMCRVSMTARKEFGGMVFPENKYIVRVLLLKEDGRPVCLEGENDAYLGTVIIASSVDTKMDEFMKGETERTVYVRHVRGET